jgi:hypothetical protein
VRRRRNRAARLVGERLAWWKTTCVVGLQSQSDQGIGALREESEPIETTGLVLVADLGLA